VIGNNATFEDFVIKSDNSKKDCVITYPISWTFESGGTFLLSTIINILSRIPDNSTVSAAIVKEGFALEIILEDSEDSEDSPVIKYYQAPIITV